MVMGFDGAEAVRGGGRGRGFFRAVSLYFDA